MENNSQCNKMTHKKKLHLARSMMTREEIIKKVSPFDCRGWRIRKEGRMRIKFKPKRGTGSGLRVIKKITQSNSSSSTSAGIIKLKWYQRIWIKIKKWVSRLAVKS